MAEQYALNDEQVREILTAQGETPERIDEYLTRHQELDDYFAQTLAEPAQAKK
jgi:hypothetical protein